MTLDALQEPFWPEGLGINRGFLHVLDCADLARGYTAVLEQRRRSSQALAELLGELGSRAAAAAASVAEMDEGLAALIARREALYNCTKRISSTTIKAELKPHVAPQDAKRELRYRIDPCSRYTHLPVGPDWDGSAQRRAAEQAEREARRVEEADWGV